MWVTTQWFHFVIISFRDWILITLGFSIISIWYHKFYFHLNKSSRNFILKWLYNRHNSKKIASLIFFSFIIYWFTYLIVCLSPSIIISLLSFSTFYFMKNKFSLGTNVSSCKIFIRLYKSTMQKFPHVAPQEKSERSSIWRSW